MTRWNDQEAAGNSTFLLGALAGALVGAGIALLMAPKTGAQMREDLNSGYNSARDAAARRYRDLADKAGQKIEDASAKFGQAGAKVEKAVDEYSSRAASIANDIASPGGFPRA
jgi:gas vesicle protein